MTFEELYEYAGGPVFITNQISQDYYSYKDATKYIMVGHYLTADGYIVTIFFENDIDAHIKEVIVECY